MVLKKYGYQTERLNNETMTIQLHTGHRFFRLSNLFKILIIGISINAQKAK